MIYKMSKKLKTKLDKIKMKNCRNKKYKKEKILMLRIVLFYRRNHPKNQ